MHTSSFRAVPFMGVIRVNEEAAEFGFKPGDPAWSNLGQGQPEVGELPGAPPRISHIAIEPDDHAYGPVEGIDELREAVAAHYNRLYRRGLASQYTADNVMITPGGRVGLSRCGAALDKIRLGHFSPDYTAYEDLLRTFDQVRPYRIDLSVEDGFRIELAVLAKIVKRHRLNTLLISNPCNPTGVVISGTELGGWLDMARRCACTLVLDEYYSHFVYGQDRTGPVSGAAYVDRVDEDPVVIMDGLTKSFRYPGWRVGWVLAPRDIIRPMTAVGSFLDGGASRPIQRAAIDVLEPERCDRESAAVRGTFARKQRDSLTRLQRMGVRIPHGPEGTFYVFGSVADLPEPFNDGIDFMREGFKSRVTTVPGAYFDVDPRPVRSDVSRLHGFVRFSFGSPLDSVRAGLDRLAAMLANVRPFPASPREPRGSVRRKSA